MEHLCAIRFKLVDSSLLMLMSSSSVLSVAVALRCCDPFLGGCTGGLRCIGFGGAFRLTADARGLASVALSAVLDFGLFFVVAVPSFDERFLLVAMGRVWMVRQAVGD